MEGAEELTGPARLIAGATTGVAGLLTLLGVNSERVWSLLDDNTARVYVVSAAVFGMVAVGLSLVVVTAKDVTRRRKLVLVLIAAALYFSALVTILMLAVEGANVSVAPTFEVVEVRPTADNAGLEIVLGLTADRLDSGQGLNLGVFAPNGEELLRTILRPDLRGQIEHQTTIVVPDPESGVVVAKVWRVDEDEPSCAEMERGSTCVSLSVPEGVTRSGS